MAPIKFEENIKDKLEQRKLQPSVKAWQQLSNQLDVDASKKSNKSFWLLAIAASFIGILVTISVLKNSEEKSSTPIIVDSQKIEELNINTLLKKSEVPILENDEQVAITNKKDDNNNKLEFYKNTSSQKTNKQLVVKQQFKKVQENIFQEPIKDAVADVTRTQELHKRNQKEETLKILTFEEQTIKDVVAEITKLKEGNSAVLDSEIDSLLNRAHRDLVKNKIFNELTKTVDANALLQDVEEDLEQSFRNKVFEALKVNYRIVKTAVADRNN